MEYRGIEYLRRKLKQKRRRVMERYRFYEMKDDHYTAQITIPKYLRDQYASTVGWCAKAVDSLADRLIFKGFKNDIFNFQELYNLNNPDILTDSAILGALISSCSFLYIYKDADGKVNMQSIDGGNATGIIDPITGLLIEGYAVLERNHDLIPIKEAYFTREATIYFEYGKEVVDIVEHKAPYALLVPIINRPDAIRPFGHSRISRACMYWQDYAKRTLERSDVTAEFYSWPQKYALGTDPDAEQLESWRATVSTFLQFDKDADGDRPVLGQFQTQSMTPFTEQLRTAAAGFAGETGLTLDELGFASDNPSSADAIRASHESLRVTAKKAQHTFGTGFINAGFIGACLRDDYTYNRDIIYEVKTRWEPIFTPDAASMGAYGDAIIKISQAAPEIVTREWIEDLLGF